MQKEKPPNRELNTKIRQMTFRISESLYEETKKDADAIGSSHNSFLSMMVSMGIKAYRGQYIIRQD